MKQKNNRPIYFARFQIEHEKEKNVINLGLSFSEEVKTFLIQDGYTPINKER